MKYLITSDLHMTDRPRDAYRFGLFPWLLEQTYEYDLDYVFILGDLTDQKDNHASKLVNAVADSLEQLAEAVEVFILPGNHDSIDINCPFFRFLNKIDNVTFVTEVSHFEGQEDILFLPFTRNPTETWKDIDFNTLKANYVFMHQTMDGAKASNGQLMDGLSRKIFKGFKGTIISGDIHVPQIVGPVLYVGSPYHVHFGDHFTPRVLLLNDGVMAEIHFDAPRKLTYEISDPEELLELDFTPNDQLKVRLKLRASELADWSTLKHQVEDICKKRNVYLHAVELLKVDQKSLKKSQLSIPIGLSSMEAFTKFCKKENIQGYIKDIGQSFLE